MENPATRAPQEEITGLPRRSKAKVVVRLRSGAIKTMPFDSACRLVENERLFLSKSQVFDLYAGTDPATPLGFTMDTKKRPRTAFLCAMDPRTEVTPLTRKGATSLAQHSRAAPGKSLIIRDIRDGGKMYSWFVTDIGRFPRWSETNLSVAIACLADVVDILCSKEKALSRLEKNVLERVMEGAQSVPSSAAMSTRNRALVASMMIKAAICLCEDVDLAALCNLSAPVQHITSSRRFFWNEILKINRLDIAASDVFTARDLHHCFLSGPYAPFLMASRDKEVQVCQGEKGMVVIATLLGMFLAPHIPLTKTWVIANPQGNAAGTTALREMELKFLTSLSDTPLWKFVQERTESSWPLILDNEPWIAGLSTSLCAMFTKSDDASRIGPVVSGTTQDDPIRALALCKSIGVHVAIDKLTDINVIAVLRKVIKCSNRYGENSVFYWKALIQSAVLMLKQHPRQDLG